MSKLFQLVTAFNANLWNCQSVKTNREYTQMIAKRLQILVTALADFIEYHNYDCKL